MHGGVKFYRGSAGAARSYVEADRSRVDDYYLAEGHRPGRAVRRHAHTRGGTPGGTARKAVVRAAGTLDGPAYERWVAGYDVETGQPKGRLRQRRRRVCGSSRSWSTVRRPGRWPRRCTRRSPPPTTPAQDRAAVEIIGWLAEHATTRVGPRGRQVQVPVEQLEAAVVRHYTSRAGDPHRHLHLQINARVFAAGAWRGLHSVGVVDSIEAINGIGHAAVDVRPRVPRGARRARVHASTPTTGEVAQLAPYAGAFSARAAQITRNIDRYEAQWRSEHPDEEPGPTLRRAWDRRAWSQARPDKVVTRERGRAPASGGSRSCTSSASLPRAVGGGAPRRPDRRVNRDAVVDLVLSRLGARRSSWNAADIRGEVERIIAAVDVVAPAPVRRELVEDLTDRTVARCVPLLARDDVPEHVRSLTSREVLDVEADLVARLTARAEQPVDAPTRSAPWSRGVDLDHAQRAGRRRTGWHRTAAGDRGRGRCRQDHHPGRRPRAARDAGQRGWWW